MTNNLDEKPSLLELSPEALREMIRSIRADRRLKKDRPSIKKKAARQRAGAKTSLSKLLNGLTPEQIEALLLGDGNGELKDAHTVNPSKGNQDKE